MKKSTKPRAKVVDKPVRRRTLAETLEQDETVQRTRKRVSKLMSRHDTHALLQEISTMQGARTVRGLSANAVVADNGKRLIEASLQNIAYRARLVEIKMMLLRMSGQASDLLMAARDYVRVTYSDDLGAIARTQADRNSFLEQMFSHESGRVRRLESVLDVADIVIDDIDQCGWSLKRITDVATMMHQTKH